MPWVLDNRPVAWYRCVQDTLDPMLLAFQGLSYFEPTDWSWYFGDGSVGSLERHPQHTFDSAGVYFWEAMSNGIRLKTGKVVKAGRQGAKYVSRNSVSCTCSIRNGVL